MSSTHCKAEETETDRQEEPPKKKRVKKCSKGKGDCAVCNGSMATCGSMFQVDRPGSGGRGGGRRSGSSPATLSLSLSPICAGQAHLAPLFLCSIAVLW